MSFIDCINKNKQLSRKQRERLISEYEDLASLYAKSMGDELAASTAAGKLMEVEANRLVQTKKNKMRDVLAWKRLNEKIDEGANYVAEQKAKAPPGVGEVLWLGSNVASATRSFFEGVYVRVHGIERRTTLALAELIEKYRPKHGGLTQDVEGFVDVFRAAMGEKTGKADTDGFGKAVREVFDMLHRRYEAAGGVIGKLDNYWPQRHNPLKVGAHKTPEPWIDFIWNLLDRKKMIDLDTGLPFTDAKLVEVLKETFEGIRTNGLNHIEKMAREGKQTFGRGRSIAKRHASARFLHFKDVDSYLAYSNKYGYGEKELFGTMMGHIETMTRDIAIMEEMGPNPAAQVERMKLKIKADGGGAQSVRTVQGMYDTLAGRTTYTGKTGLAYDTTMATQNWLRASLLPGASLSALSDQYYLQFTAKLNGLKATKAMKSYYSILNPANGADRRLARRISFIAGNANSMSYKNIRYAEDMGGRGRGKWAANAVNSFSGLAAMTDAVKQTLPMETGGFMAEAKAMRMSWEDLPDAMREAFRRWDITEDDFNNIKRSTPWVDPKSKADFIMPEQVAEAGYLETATRYENWMVDMMFDASNEPRLLTRAIATGATLGDASQGTILRATVSSLMMLKSFGVTVMMNHALKSMRHAATSQGVNRLSRIAPFLMGTTFYGLITVFAKDIVYGKEPRELNEKTVGAAMLQAGGFGIFGDLLFADHTRWGGALVDTAAGPVAGFANDAVSQVASRIEEIVDKDEDFDWDEIVKFNKKWNPLLAPAKFWYTRLLAERLMLDQVERMADPNYDKRIRRVEKKLEEEYGQRFWWTPGETLPEGM